MTDHTCTTADGVRIVVGLIVFNNNLDPVTVIEPPRLYPPDAPCDGAGHGATMRPGECWWETRSPTGREEAFDGSRLVTGYRFREHGWVNAEDAWERAKAQASEDTPTSNLH